MQGVCVHTESGWELTTAHREPRAASRPTPSSVIRPPVARRAPPSSLRPPAFLPGTCHFESSVSCVFLLASAADFRQNTSTYLDEASLAEL
jgi:hypothetical protein